MKRNFGIVLALATVALGSFAVEKEILANEADENTAFSSEANATSGPASLGGPFSLKVRDVTFREVSAGGVFRLAGSTHLKAAGDEVFSDDFETGDSSMWSDAIGEFDLPSGAVAIFELEECPEGWDDIYGLHRGRAIVGLMPGGQLNGTVGSQTNGQSGFHYHDIDYSPTTDSFSHNHRWAYLMGEPDRSWRSYSATGSVVTLIQWSDGIDGDGSGYYLFAPTPQQSFYTENAAHSHEVGFSSVVGGNRDPAPNVQLRICQKQ